MNRSRKARTLALALALLATAAACGNKPAAPLTLEMLKSTEYTSEWPADGVAELTDGTYREKIMEGSASEILIVMHPIYAIGDLNGDGAEDAIVVLVSSGGGSGSFYTLEAVLNQDGKPKHVATAFLGDRADLKSIAVDSGEITVEMTTHGPNDPMCCPSLEVTQVYELQGETLVQLSGDS